MLWNQDGCLAGGWGATAHKIKMKPRRADSFWISTPGTPGEEQQKNTLTWGQGGPYAKDPGRSKNKHIYVEPGGPDAGHSTSDYCAYSKRGAPLWRMLASEKKVTGLTRT